MIKELYLNRLKILFRNKEVLFWGYFFPLILGAFFYLSFMEEKDEVDVTWRVALVRESERSAADLEELVNDIESQGEEVPLFQVSIMQQEEAKAAFEAKALEAYVLLGKEPELVVRQRNPYEQLLVFALETYQSDPLKPELLQNASETMPIITYDNGLKDLNGKRRNNFFCLIGISCFITSLVGLREIEDIQYNLSFTGRRMSFAPVRQGKLLVAGVLAGWTISFTQTLCVLIYVFGVFKISLVSPLKCLVLIAAASLYCVIIGMLVGSVKKGKRITKQALIAIGTVASGTLSGMIYEGIKYYGDYYLPALNYISPVGMIDNALYTLGVHKITLPFWISVGCMTGYSLLGLGVIYLNLRRKAYAYS